MSAVDLGDLVTPDSVILDCPAPNKRSVLVALATRAAQLAEQQASRVVDVILEREALGSTGFGSGTAIPHGRLPGLGRSVVIAARLAAPVDFAALDGLPVDLVMLMLAPSSGGADHLKALARVSRALRDSEFCKKLRGAVSPDAFYVLLAGEHRLAV